MNKPSQQIGGSHYENKAIQPITLIEKFGLNFHEGNIVKYISRWKDKNGLEDVKKAEWYANRLKELNQPKLHFKIDEKEQVKLLNFANDYINKNNLGKLETSIIMDVINYHLALPISKSLARVTLKDIIKNINKLQDEIKKQGEENVCN